MENSLSDVLLFRETQQSKTLTYHISIMTGDILTKYVGMGYFEK